jgi:glycosyltransferase involved in cell wall biosynthesis
MMPSKTYYAMAVGSALIGLSRPPNDLADVIEESGCGINIEPGDLNGLIHAINNFVEDGSYLHQCKLAARKVAVQKYARSVNSGMFANVIKTCFSNV